MNEWISADAEERPPELEDILICQRYGESGRLVQMVGRYIPAHTELASDDCDDWVDYNEETDEYYTPAGWYECQHNWGEFAYINCCEGEVTHWKHLDPLPGDEQ